ncbi:tetratricopeptide repeat protein [Aureibaculum algae]|uniref:Tetratricopeptide repeat protein n=1 Tax=Aureibaculum algae TaxID=2584122 RepID=A0A5B7TZZ4_9FLAO|nr:tetratricopeptide repeat protein [Aureibaculum algae]QCX40347.1 tetratricopeptide repeat protein [Aureibaculum algae]
MGNKIFSLPIILFIFFFVVFNVGRAQDIIPPDSLFEKAEFYKFQKLDSAVYFYNKSIEFQMQKKDTSASIMGLRELSFLYSHNVDYGKSYDGYWSALLLADKSKDSISLGLLYQDLGWLYGYYKRDSAAKKYFNQSILIHKKMKASPLENYKNLRSNYFSLAVFYRDNEDFEMAKKYLDSTNQMQTFITEEIGYYAEGELAYIDHKEGRSVLAIERLRSCEYFFKETNKSYLVIIYFLLGEVYRETNSFKESEASFEESLRLCNIYHSHSNYLPRIYTSLSKLYYANNRYKEAFFSLEKAHNLNDKIFGSRSDNNQHLLEIKDDYRVEKQKQEALVKEQRLAELEHEDRVWLLKSILLSVTILFILFYAILFTRNLRLKHRSEKEVLRKKQELDQQRQNETLEIKNKQLAASALQLIEKEEFLESLKGKLAKQEDKIDTRVIERMISSVQRNPSSSWKEFEVRFTNINQSFYKNLKEKFPKLTQADQKLCALVKLNFSSKEMSSILGISIESVHTSRYRLRKKLDLDRKDSLTEFINNL